MKGMPSVVAKTEPEIKALDTEIARLEALLASPMLTKVNQLFVDNRIKMHKNEWYKPSGINDFRSMAKDLGREAEYKLFYGSYSNVSHGFVFDLQVSHDNEGVVYEHIRNMRKLDEIIRMGAVLALRIYRMVIARYRPEELSALGRKYESEWKERFNSIPVVDYKFGVYTIRKKLKKQ
jgi:hypothetical protein